MPLSFVPRSPSTRQTYILRADVPAIIEVQCTPLQVAVKSISEIDKILRHIIRRRSHLDAGQQSVSIPRVTAQIYRHMSKSCNSLIFLGSLILTFWLVMTERPVNMGKGRIEDKGKTQNRWNQNIK